MRFLVFRCRSEPDCFIVTTEAHKTVLSGDVCPTPGDKLEKIGAFQEMGEERAAFNEKLAKQAIEENGFYRFHSKTFDPVSQPPLSMP